MTNTAAVASSPVALITGASTGIGLELAKLFARDKYALVLVARNLEQLDAVAADLRSQFGVRVEVIAKDLSSPTAPDEIVEAVRALGLDVDVLVNNAGFGSQGPFAEADLAGQLRMVQVNVSAVTHLTGLLLPGMVARRRGRVLNVASTAAFQPGPLMAVYYATKAYVLSFSEAIADELRDTGVTVTALCPGPTATEFNQRGGIFKKRPKGSVMNAPTVARIGYAGVLAGRRVVVPGLKNRLLVTGGKFAPRRLVTRIARELNQAKQ